MFYAYIIQHNKEYKFYLINCHFKIVFNENQYNIIVNSNLFDNKTMISWKKNSKKVNDDFRNKGYNFNHIDEISIILIVNKKRFVI